MPTQRFLKLKEEKKQVILDAAVHEFSRVPYSSASINQIIKEADISRGSFYTYFEDKDDLMRYILRGFRDNCQKKIFEFLREEQGNPFEAAGDCDGTRRRWAGIQDVQEHAVRHEPDGPDPSVRH